MDSHTLEGRNVAGLLKEGIHEEGLQWVLGLNALFAPW